ncbi:MAG: DUF4339 domain-containing protein [Gemmataceae bacterium]|jgi:TM2 domain-containing membrane protein YozV|nr:DUF4339 domain-containing protein [Gemmataceae bacterium]
MNQDWYYAIGEDRQGPISLDELRQLATDGTLRPSDLVWNETMSDWKQAGQVRELQDYFVSRRNRTNRERFENVPRPTRHDDQEDYDDQYGGPSRDKMRLPRDIANQKITAGILALLLGGLGVHKFYLGFNTAGTIILVCTLVSWALAIVSCGLLFFLPMIFPIITLVEGIIYLTKSDRDFHYDYNIHKKEWF